MLTFILTVLGIARADLALLRHIRMLRLAALEAGG